MSVLEGLPQAVAAAEGTPEPPPPEATLTPPAMTVFNAARQYGRDYATFWSRLAQADDPMDAWQAETDSGMALMRDAWSAYAEFWMLPYRIWSVADKTRKT